MNYRSVLPNHVSQVVQYVHCFKQLQNKQQIGDKTNCVTGICHCDGDLDYHCLGVEAVLGSRDGQWPQSGFVSILTCSCAIGAAFYVEEERG